MSLTPNIDRAVSQAAGYVKGIWEQVVMGQIQVPGATTPRVNVGLRDIYAKSITLDKMLVGQGSTSQKVIALAQIARDLENGKGPWDMKPMLLNGPKARVSARGVKYNIIPFRHGTSDNYAPNSNFNTIPKTIYAKARELKATLQQANKMAYGGRLKSHFGTGINLTTGYEHKAPIHEGMVRIEKTYAKATQSKYLTFRIVSANSDPLSWWHPGYQAQHIAQAVTNFCRPGIEEMIQEAAIADLITDTGLDIKVV